jgi:aryl-alcohol dehydrogenase-like predicted oxidoreductase
VLRSLDRLRLSRLDAVLLHSDGVEEASGRFLPAMEALATLKGEGLIRATGFSGKSVPGNMAMIGIADMLMATYNRQETEQAPVIRAAGEKGLGVLIKKALSSGHAADPAVDLAMAAGLAGVSAVVIGTLSPDHLRANVRAVTAA